MNFEFFKRLINKDPNFLPNKCFSQNGEDGIIDYLLHSLKIDKPKFVEIGIGDYSECNSRLFSLIF